MRTFGHDIPKLSWLGGKTARQSNGGHKNRSGYKQEHTEAIAVNMHHDAILEDGSRTQALEEKNLQGSQN